MNTLIPCNLEVQIRVTFTDKERYFICSNDKTPRFTIKGKIIFLKMNIWFQETKNINI